MTSSNGEAIQLYEITYLGAGPEPEAHAGRHGIQVLVRPCRRPVEGPGTRKENAS
ncbi:hypothetical protein GCM10017750_57450 [Streptomyces racemochromogenes]